MPREWEWTCVVPMAGPAEVTHGFLAHIEPEHLPRFLLVDNSRDSHVRALNLEERGARVLYHPENLGCARSWNLALREGHEQTIICSASMRFDQGGFSAFLRVLERGANAYGMYTWDTWHLLSIGKATVEEIGLVDENFYPAYGEDLDYMRRMIVGNIIGGPPPHGGQHPLRHAPASCIGNGMAMRTGAVIVAHPDTWLEYYARKWGGGQAKETFDHPFGNPENSLKFWEPATVDELKVRYKLV